MKKKRKLSPQEYQVYKKQHDYEDVVAAEESKISNEKQTYTKLQKKSKRQIKRKIQSIQQVEDLEILEDDLEDPEEEQLANRIIRNARTHKDRLGGLKEFEES
ncbi:MAG TPA: hypothetical protein VK856_06000 [Anaerolineaceae bacterium]|nr:hypothetical protein [Anaerolineaceae bacterium]